MMRHPALADKATAGGASPSGRMFLALVQCYFIGARGGGVGLTIARVTVLSRV